MTEASVSRAYRMRRDDRGRLRRVYTQSGVEVYYETVTRCCSGCTEVPEMTPAPEAGAGCEECGFTGKRRERVPVPFCNHQPCVEALYTGATAPTVPCLSPTKAR